MPRSNLLAVTLAALLACSSDPSDTTTGPQCPAGQAKSSAGNCEWQHSELPCGPGTVAAVGDTSCHPVGWTSCPAGTFEPTQWGCLDVTPPADCGPGTMPRLGERACVAVGWTSCPAGFVKDASGWGCRDVLPAAACTGATRDALGSQACAPVGDCTAAFPPANATLFVNAAGTTDATHFRTITAALNAAPAGAVIAVEAGSYNERIAPARAVTVVGRCAEKVVVQGTSSLRGGVLAVGVPVEVRGVTVRGFVAGALAQAGGVITLKDSVLTSNYTTSVVATDLSTAKSPSEVRLERSVVRDTLMLTADAAGIGLLAQTGGRIALTDSVVTSSRGPAAVVVSGTGGVMSTLGLTRSVVRDTLAEKSGAGGIGMSVEQGASVTLVESAIVGATASGMIVQGAASAAVLTRSVIRGTRAEAGPKYGEAMTVQTGAKASVESSALLDNALGGIRANGVGSAVTLTNAVVRTGAACSANTPCKALELLKGATANVAGSALVESIGAGVFVTDKGALQLATSLVRDTRPLGVTGGYGVFVSPGTLVLSDSALVGNGNDGLLVNDGRTWAKVTRTIVSGTKHFNDPEPVAGVMVSEGAKLELDQGALVGNAQAGLRVKGVEDASKQPPGARTLATVTNTILRDGKPGLSGPQGVGAAVDQAGQLDATDCLFLRNLDSGATVVDQGSVLNLVRTTLADTRSGGTGEYGTGVYAANAQARLEDTAVVNAYVFGVYAVRSTLALERALVSSVGVSGAGSRYGYGVAAAESTARLTSSQVTGAAAVGVLFAKGQGVIAASVIDHNAIALQAQDGSAISEQDAAPADVAPLQAVVARDTFFLENATKVGSGELPLPEPVRK